MKNLKHELSPEDQITKLTLENEKLQNLNDGLANQAKSDRKALVKTGVILLLFALMFIVAMYDIQCQINKMSRVDELKKIYPNAIKLIDVAYRTDSLNKELISFKLLPDDNARHERTDQLMEDRVLN